MRTVFENIYKYSELSKEVQQRVFRRMQEQVQEYYQYDAIKDDIREQLELNGFEVTQIYIDNSYCQGSGACFEGYFRPEDVKSKEFFGEVFDFTTYSKSHQIIHYGRYYHEESVNIYLVCNPDEAPLDIEYGFKNQYEYLCRKIFSIAQKDYESATSDEVVMEVINEKEFYENGMGYMY